MIQIVFDPDHPAESVVLISDGAPTGVGDNGRVASIGIFQSGLLAQCIGNRHQPVQRVVAIGGRMAVRIGHGDHVAIAVVSILAPRHTILRDCRREIALIVLDDRTLPQRVRDLGEIPRRIVGIVGTHVFICTRPSGSILVIEDGRLEQPGRIVVIDSVPPGRIHYVRRPSSCIVSKRSLIPERIGYQRGVAQGVIAQAHRVSFRIGYRCRLAASIAV